MTETLSIFITTYLGVALGRIPGLMLDRTGIALLGAIAMIVVGTISFPQAVQAVDLPTIVLLYALMVVSAQLRLGGFYTRTAFWITSVLVHPRFFLWVAMLNHPVLRPFRARPRHRNDRLARCHFDAIERCRGGPS